MSEKEIRDQLRAISPIDGRYKQKVQELADFFSEEAIIKYRVKIETEYLIALSEHDEIGLRSLSAEEQRFLRSLNIDDKDIGLIVKKYEAEINHDVKAVEYFIKERLRNNGSLEDCLEWVHFATTSADINNMSYALMLSEGLTRVIIPALENLLTSINTLSQSYKDIPMLARTHGQPASPTTVGKEFKVPASRIERQLEQLKNGQILVKLNGATGNYNAHLAAYPNVDWLSFTKNFIEGLNKSQRLQIKLSPNLITTQIEPHDSYIEIFDILRRINTILIGFNQDMWRYISDGWFIQKIDSQEVGSSTMPHKINPIDFENSEGNLGVANALLNFFSNKLPISRLQRDLSDTTVMRNFGSALAYCLLGYQSASRGLSKIGVDLEKILEALESHPELLAEAIQTILRREAYPVPYENLKDLTRGKKVSMNDFKSFIDRLSVPDAIKQELQALKPANYTGLASKLV